MKFLELTLYNSREIVLVNPMHIRTVDRAPTGGVYINFSDGQHVKVSETMTEIDKQLSQEP